MANPGNNGDDAAGSANAHRPIFMRDVDEELLNEKKTGFISTVRLVDLDIEPKALTGLAVRETIAEFFPPAELFSPDLRALPAIYKELRDWLNANGANLQQHSSRRIMMTLAANLYTEPEDTEAAISIVEDIIAAGRRPQTVTGSAESSASVPIQQRGNGGTDDKLAYNIAMRFK